LGGVCDNTGLQQELQSEAGGGSIERGDWAAKKPKRPEPEKK